MMNRFNILTIATYILFATYCNSQTSVVKMSGDVKSDLAILIPDGNRTVDMLGIKPNPRLLELAKKWKESMQTHSEWYLNYIKTAKEGETLPYHKNFGITEDEYKEIQELKNQVERVPLSKEEIEVERIEDKIKFKGTGKLAILEIVQIDLKNNHIFKATLLEEVTDRSKLLVRENYYIEKYNAVNCNDYYNLAKAYVGGNCSYDSSAIKNIFKEKNSSGLNCLSNPAIANFLL